MPVKIYGAPISCNCVGPLMLTMESKAGKLEYVNFKKGDLKSADCVNNGAATDIGRASACTDHHHLTCACALRAVHAYGQMPGMTDDDVKIGESTAILRYIAMK